MPIGKMIVDILIKTGILLTLLIFVFICISVLITIYTYINMRVRTGNFIEGFENSQNNNINNKVNEILTNGCLNKTTKHVYDLDKYNIGEEENDCPRVNAQTPFIGLLLTNYNCENEE